MNNQRTKRLLSMYIKREEDYSFMQGGEERSGSVVHFVRDVRPLHSWLFICMHALRWRYDSIPSKVSMQSVYAEWIVLSRQLRGLLRRRVQSRRPDAEVVGRSRRSRRRDIDGRRILLFPFSDGGEVVRWWSDILHSSTSRRRPGAGDVWGISSWTGVWT